MSSELPPILDLTGRTALVTGAGQNLGAEIARALASRGGAVAVNDLVLDRAETVVEQIRANGGKAVAACGDVTSAEAVLGFVAETERALGPVDILVNNAGLPANNKHGRLHEISLEDWDPVLRVNVYGVLQCTHTVVGGMCERGWGRVISIMSEAGRIGERNLAVYSAAKAAVGGLSKALALEVGRQGVTSNCVSIGTIGPVPPGELRERMERKYPVGRLGEPADVAAMVLFLASDEASWVTGQTVVVNGGWATS